MERDGARNMTFTHYQYGCIRCVMVGFLMYIVFERNCLKRKEL